MSTDIGSDIQQLLQEGNAALRVGDMYDARQRFRRATELDPNSISAWLGLAAAVRPFAEKREAFERVLALEPLNEEARLGLEYVDRKLAEGEVMALPDRRERATAALASPPPPTTVPFTPATDIEYCYRHPDRETGLHCSICNRPICTQCAQPGPVGQICPECARERRPRNYQVNTGDIIIASLVAFFVTLPIAVLAGLFLRGFFVIILLFVIGPAIAELIVRAVERTTKMKRGRPMQVAVGCAIGLACAATFLVIPNGLVLLIFAFLAISTAAARLR